MLSLHFWKRHHRLNLVRTGHVRNYRGKIKFERDGVFRVRVGAEFVSILPPRINVGVAVTGATFGATRSGALGVGELADARTQIIYCHFIEWEHTRQRAPLGSHVSDGHAR